MIYKLANLVQILLQQSLDEELVYGDVLLCDEFYGLLRGAPANDAGNRVEPGAAVPAHLVDVVVLAHGIRELESRQ
jgi:hypothetical protein